MLRYTGALGRRLSLRRRLRRDGWRVVAGSAGSCASGGVVLAAGAGSCVSGGVARAAGGVQRLGAAGAELGAWLVGGAGSESGAWPKCSAGGICATNIASGRGTRGMDLPCTACAPTATLIG